MVSLGTDTDEIKKFNYELYNTFDLLVMSISNKTFMGKVHELRGTWFTLFDTFLLKIMDYQKFFRYDLLAKSMLCLTIMELGVFGDDQSRLEEAIN
jgi:hypothetical protein